MASKISRGSLWHRWDPHIHAPGTLMSDQFKGDWNDYLKRIETATPRIDALGVTDYLSIGTYKEFLTRRSGRLKDIFVFPNVEMRLTISTEKAAPINFHLLFSPHSPDHIEQIERVLARLQFSLVDDRAYLCTDRDLEQLGRRIDPIQTDALGARRMGAQQFKVSLEDIERLFKSDRWLQDNCITAVAAGTTDGTAGLKNDDSYVATRRNIERFADIIFSASPSQRDFWLGKKTENRDSLERIYRGPKPCIHGSDAHKPERVANPDNERYCWVKGDLCFDTLRQVLLEPEDRVWIGPTAPEPFAPSRCISEVEISGAPWIATTSLPLNPGFVAIIGARGSGKTALMEIIAAGTGAARADTAGEASFLQKAEEHIGGAQVTISWADGSKNAPASLRLRDDFDLWGEESVCYLSQQFVERLCSSAGLAVELRREIERVVFDALDRTQRLEAESFDQLSATMLDPVRARRQEIAVTIQTLGDEIAKEQVLELSAPKLIRQRQQIADQVAKDRQQLSKLLPKGLEQRAKRLADLERACSNTEAAVETLNRRLQQLQDLRDEIDHTAKEHDARHVADLKRRFNLLEFKDEEWKAFSTRFSGDVAAIIAAARKETEISIRISMEGQPDKPLEQATTPLTEWPLNLLRAAREAARKDVGLDTQKQRSYIELQKLITQREAVLKKLDGEVAHANGAVDRRKELVTKRREAYQRLIETIVREEGLLRALYAPLEENLKGANGALTKLRFVVKRSIDLDGWVAAGEKLLDLRKASEFQRRGSLRQRALERLFKPWSNGSASDVAAAMDSFREQYSKDLLAAKKAVDDTPEAEKRWTQDVATWLYDTSHISVEYGIEYEGVAVERLSPGTRGIVLLLVYLAIDKQDLRPLLIDQPEENLDPKSVFDDLVPYFREARKRRQVIIVTHNPNLVVNTDADQVIVASAGAGLNGQLPTITYECGPLEHAPIRDKVADILEGTRRAFVDRARRYGYRIVAPGQTST